PGAPRQGSERYLAPTKIQHSERPAECRLHRRVRPRQGARTIDLESKSKIYNFSSRRQGCTDVLLRRIDTEGPRRGEGESRSEVRLDGVAGNEINRSTQRGKRQ